MEYEQLEASFGCPHCHAIAIPPIYQCERGHLICKKCITILLDRRCPTCRGSLPRENIRFLSKEIEFGEVSVKCRNSLNGCGNVSKAGELEEHFVNCKFIEGSWCQKFSKLCSEKYLLQEFSSHCEHSHKDNYLPLPPSKKKMRIQQNPETFQLRLEAKNLSFICDKPWIFDHLVSGNSYILTTTICKETRVVTWRVYFRRGGKEDFPIEGFKKGTVTIRTQDCSVSWDLKASKVVDAVSKSTVFPMLETFTLSMETLFRLELLERLKNYEGLRWELTFNFPET